MKIGASFPTQELKDPRSVREFAQGVDTLGLDHLTALDHILGTRSERSGGREGYTPETHVHEPLTLFAYLAGVTSSIQLTTSVLVLPQRQAVLVARQAAQIDVLSEGRMRLAIGLGSNEVESSGLGTDFHTRGARVEEQIDVMRALWTQQVVTFHGRWHHIDESGIMVLPVQRPIPLWMGGGSSGRSLERIGRMADGWIPSSAERGRIEPQLEAIYASAKAAGRDPGSLGIQGRLALAGGGPDAWLQAVLRWKEVGATHVTLNTSRAGFTTPAEHLRLIERFLAEVGAQASA